MLLPCLLTRSEGFSSGLVGRSKLPVLCGYVQPNTPMRQVTVKLKHQLADGTVDESEIDKYRKEFCEDMTKPSEVARPAPAAKIGGECKVENQPQ